MSVHASFSSNFDHVHALIMNDNELLKMKVHSIETELLITFNNFLERSLFAYVSGQSSLIQL